MQCIVLLFEEERERDCANVFEEESCMIFFTVGWILYIITDSKMKMPGILLLDYLWKWLRDFSLSLKSHNNKSLIIHDRR